MIFHGIYKVIFHFLFEVIFRGILKVVANAFEHTHTHGTIVRKGETKRQLNFCPHAQIDVGLMYFLISHTELCVYNRNVWTTWL